MVFGTTIFFELFGLHELSKGSLEHANDVHIFQLGFFSISDEILTAFLNLNVCLLLRVFFI